MGRAEVGRQGRERGREGPRPGPEGEDHQTRDTADPTHGGQGKGQRAGLIHPAGGKEEQKHLQFSAISRHFEATKWSLCIDGIVAVDPRERMKRCPRLPGGDPPVSQVF